MAAGFIGIVVAKLKIYPTEIDIWGLKFHSPDLPFVVIGSLCAVIGYFLIKFLFSYLFEKSSSSNSLLAEQITAGKISLDIDRAEEELDLVAQGLLIQQDSHRTLQENARETIKSLQEQFAQVDMSHTARLKAHDEKISAAREFLAKNPDDPIQLNESVSSARGNHENALLALEDARMTYLLDREDRLLKEAASLKSEIDNAKVLSERLARDMTKDEKSFHGKRDNILEWKKQHRAVGRITPFHLALEIWFPILLGLCAILSLGYLMFHLPPPPKPLLLPEF